MVHHHIHHIAVVVVVTASEEERLALAGVVASHRGVRLLTVLQRTVHGMQAECTVISYLGIHHRTDELAVEPTVVDRESAVVAKLGTLCLIFAHSRKIERSVHLIRIVLATHIFIHCIVVIRHAYFGT